MNKSKKFAGEVKTYHCDFCNKVCGPAMGKRIGMRFICHQCIKIPKLKIRNPSPIAKRRAARDVIEWDLKTYCAMKEEVDSIMKEIDEEAAPSATDVRENIYTKSKEMRFKGGFNISVVIGESIHSVSDTTASKAELIRQYRESRLGATEYREMIRRMNAIERTIERLEKSNIIDDNLRSKMIRMKYFDQDKSDRNIAQILNIDVRTLYRWQSKTINEIAKELGFII